MIKKPSYEELEKRIQELEQAEYSRKQSEEKLLRSYDLMDYIISHARSAIAIFDRDLKYIYVSKRYLKDYKIKTQNIIGKHHYDVFSDLPEKWKDVHQRSLTGEVVSAEEDPYYRADGSVHWTQWECRPWYESNGSIGGIVIYNEIINERKKAEETLRKSEQLLATHLLNTPIGAISWDLNFMTVEWNPAAEKMFGYSKIEAMGKHISELILPDDIKKLTDDVFKNLISEKGGTHSINENITKEGRRITCDWYNTALKDIDGNIIGMASLVSDITDRKRAEKELSKFKIISDTANYGSAITDLEGNFEYINDYFAEIHGFSSEELIGQNLSVFHNEKQIEGVKEINENFIKNGSYSALEIWHTHRNGTQFPMLMAGAILNDEYGNPQYMTATAIDLSERKKLESYLQQSQKVESIGTLAGGIAHDFNNILFPIIGHTEMLLEDVPEDSPFREGLHQIYTGAMRASKLIKQILTFSRQDTNELKLMKMQPIIKEALKLIRSTIPTTIEIKQDITTDNCAVKADPTQIHQIIMNLATNAYHAMEDTGGKLMVSLKKIKFEALDQIDPDMRPGDYVCLSIADTGVGMDKILTDKIFDPFFTTKEKGKGTGMGLSVVHGIVKSRNGAIKVYSEPGQGTEVHVYLPVEKNFSELPVNDSKAEIQVGTEKILLVDDEEEILTMEKRMLTRLGYQITSRTSSLEALEAFRANPDKFDLVITDMAMPNMSGDKLSAELAKIRPGTPVLLCTGFSETMSEEKAASLGIKGFLLKPVVMKDLSQKIRGILDTAAPL